MDHRRDERGIALPSVVTVLSILAVAAAAVAFFVTVGHSHHPSDVSAQPPPTGASSPAAPGSSTPASPAATSSRTVVKASTSTSPRPKPRPVRVDRGSVSVVVFNDTAIAGLASSVGSRIDALGWRFVGASNWSGPVPASTVYYPPRLRTAGEELARDLHIDRLRPAQVPAMASDRLTVILTGRLD